MLAGKYGCFLFPLRCEETEECGMWLQEGERNLNEAAVEGAVKKGEKGDKHAYGGRNGVRKRKKERDRNSQKRSRQIDTQTYIQTRFFGVKSSV